MQTLGYLFIIVGLFILLQASKGRGLTEIPKDIGDLTIALVETLTNPTEGSAKVREIMARTNKVTTITEPETAFHDISLSASGKGRALLTEMQRLAASVNYTYIYGAEGPNAYDCSGLVWAAMKKLGIYTGSRFTTYTFVSAMGNKITKVTGTPYVGDIVLWASHIGVIDGEGTMYSALNSREGIKHSPLSYGPKGESYTLYRLN